jgi:hypothetical protein
MIINSLKQMENIVENNKSLKWVGWDVVEYTPSHNAATSKDGVYVDGKWLLAKVYKVSPSGWEIPKQWVRDDAKR